MDTLLWIDQGLLAFMFLMAGMMKLMQPKEKMADMMGWVEDFTQNQIRLIGLAEVMAALALILPGLTGIMPVLTPLAATGLVVLMTGAAATHLRRKENAMMAMNLMLLALAAFVAVGRFFLAPL